MEFNCHIRGFQIRRLFPSPSWFGQEGHTATKKTLMDRQLVTEQDFLKNESVTMTKRKILETKCCWRLVVYHMLVGSSRPYPRLIVEENDDDDDDDE